jgi:Holliday junction resolvase RusA-like endonuclease
MKDLDNLAKFTLDALNGRAWLDDRQVMELVLSKIARSNNPRTVLHIEELPTM